MKKFGLFIFIVLSVFLLASCIDFGGTQYVYRTITYNSNGGTDVAKQIRIHGTTADKPQDPKWAGDGEHEFLGWYYNNLSYDFGEPVKADITLEAHWTGASKEQTVLTNEVLSFSNGTSKSIQYEIETTPDGSKENKTTVDIPEGAIITTSTENSMSSEITITTYAVAVATTEFTISGENKIAVAGIDCKLEITENGEKREVSDFNGKSVKVTTYTLKGLESPSVVYNGDGDQPTNVSYDEKTGLLSFNTTHFSTFLITSDAVAYISETKYAYNTLSNAVSAAKENDTVILIKNISIEYTDNSTEEDLLRVEDKNLTIDGNGKTIYVKATNNYATAKHNLTYGLHIVGETKNTLVDVKNLTVEASGAIRYAVCYDGSDDGKYCASGSVKNCTVKCNYVGLGVSGNDFGDSEVNLYNCDISHNGENDDYSEENKTKYLYCAIAPQFDGKINVYSGNYESTLFAAYIYSTGGTLNIYGGTFKAATESTVGTVLIAQVSNSYSKEHKKAEINISSGSFDGKIETSGTDTQGSSISISGGEFKNTTFTTSAKSDNANSYTEITGGVFSTDPTAYVADGYFAKPNTPTTGKWTVVENKYWSEFADTSWYNDSTTEFALDSAEELAGLAVLVNAGNTFEGKTIKLTDNIDLSENTWIPIGNISCPFLGGVDGQTYTIKGLRNGPWKDLPASIKDTWGVTQGALNEGVPFGFIGTIGSKTGAGSNILIQNINFTDVDINCEWSNMMGVLVGADTAAATKDNNGKVNSDFAGDITIKNITVSGSIVCTNSTGATVSGIVGKLYTKGNIDIQNCTNNANISCEQEKVKISGIVGYIAYFKSFTMKNCINNGSLTLTHATNSTCMAGGLITVASTANYTTSNSLVFDNVQNNGDIICLVNCPNALGRIVAASSANKNVWTCSNYSATGKVYKDTNTEMTNVFYFAQNQQEEIAQQP